MAKSGSFNHFPAIILALKKATQDQVDKTAGDVAQAATGRAPVLTGYLRSSVYTVTSKASTYAAGIVGTGELLAELPNPGEGKALVGVAASHGVYVEYGTHKMAAQPFITPAAEGMRSQFESEMAKALSDAATGAAK